MIYCPNPDCAKPRNALRASFCSNCGTPLKIGDRFLLTEPLEDCQSFLAIDQHLPSRPRCIMVQRGELLPAAGWTEEQLIRLEYLGNRGYMPQLLALLDCPQPRSSSHGSSHGMNGGSHVPVHQLLAHVWVGGTSLSHRLEQDGALDELRLRGYLDSLLGDLIQIHDQGFIHGDIRPSTLVERSGDQRLMAVSYRGISPMMEGAIATPASGGIVAAPQRQDLQLLQYWAPERRLGQAVPASDLYSLGVSAIQLLTAQPLEQLFDVAEDCWCWEDRLEIDISDGLKALLNGLLERATRRRYGSAVEVLRDLNHLDDLTALANLEEPVAALGPEVASGRLLGELADCSLQGDGGEISQPGEAGLSQSELETLPLSTATLELEDAEDSRSSHAIANALTDALDRSEAELEQRVIYGDLAGGLLGDLGQQAIAATCADGLDAAMDDVEPADGSGGAIAPNADTAANLSAPTAPTSTAPTPAAISPALSPPQAQARKVIKIPAALREEPQRSRAAAAPTPMSSPEPVAQVEAEQVEVAEVEIFEAEIAAVETPESENATAERNRAEALSMAIAQSQSALAEATVIPPDSVEPEALSLADQADSQIDGQVDKEVDGQVEISQAPDLSEFLADSSSPGEAAFPGANASASLRPGLASPGVAAPGQAVSSHSASKDGRELIAMVLNNPLKMSIGRLVQELASRYTEQGITYLPWAIMQSLKQLPRSPENQLSFAMQLLEMADFYRDQVRQGHRDVRHLTLGIVSYEQALNRLNAAHGKWPLVCQDLGRLYLDLSRQHPSHRLGCIERSIATYQRGLADVVASDGVYLELQNHLGEAFGTLAASQKPVENWTGAIAAYQAALDVCPAQAPDLSTDEEMERNERHGAIQNNLGTALWNLSLHGSPSEASNVLQAAIAAYNAALAHHDPEADPLRFGMIQNNLGTAYLHLAQSEKSIDLLRLATGTYQVALMYRKRHEVPLAHAATQNNLGAASLQLASHPYADPQTQRENLEQSIIAYDSALKLLRELSAVGALSFGFDPAVTRLNLALAHQRFGCLEQSHDSSSVVFAHLETAMQFYLQLLDQQTQGSDIYELALEYLGQTMHHLSEHLHIADDHPLIKQVPNHLVAAMSQQFQRQLQQAS